jgi:peptide/nickel transport system permease protein
VLSLFFSVGLLDSLHYRVALPDTQAAETVYSPEVFSVLDRVVGPLRVNTEKTYSAPLAANLFAKETVADARGRVAREFPRLKFGGAHLEDESQRVTDAVKRAAIGGAAGLLVGVLLVWAMRGWISQRGVLLAIIISAALIGITINLAAAYHVLGTDKVGQDVLYLSLKSIRTGLVIGTVTTLVTLPIGILLGIAAGYFRGWVDDVIQYVYTVLSSIPGVLLIAAAVLIMQVTIETHPEWFDTTASRADLRLVFLCLILGVTSWTGLCRLLRGETLKLREMEYIQAAQSFGVSPMRILTTHIMPNVMHIILIALVMDFSGLVLAEAVLSYVGVGVDPSMISFGTMINGARLEMGREPMVWWSLASAFCFMLVLVLASNLFADAVRDAFDPRLNRTV